MKIKLLFIFLICCELANAQTDSTQIIRKNVLGFSVFRGYIRGFELKYERMFKNNFTVGCFADIKKTFFQNPNYDTLINSSPSLTKQWYSLVPFVRYYFSKSKMFPKGFYAQCNVIINYHIKWIVTYGDSTACSGGSFISTCSYVPKYTETRSFLSCGLGVAIGKQFLIKKRISFDMSVGFKWVPYPLWISKSKTVNGVQYDLVTHTRTGWHFLDESVSDAWGWKGKEGGPGNNLLIQWSVGYAF